MELDGKVALVTGGARRLGRALALGLADGGADVVVNHHASAAEAEEVVARIRALGRRALAVRADVGRGEECERLVRESVSAMGRLDVLVNNASTFQAVPLEALSEEVWDRTLAVNLKGPFLLARAAAPLLRQHGAGVIVNLADLSAFRAWPGYAAHAVSKAGLVHLTRVLARALAPAVRVNCIVPGTVLPPEDSTPQELRESWEETPLRRIGSPDDVVSALLFQVASDFATGQVLVLDGGRLLV